MLAPVKSRPLGEFLLRAFFLFRGLSGQYQIFAEKNEKALHL
jgi:hypothetical protein